MSNCRRMDVYVYTVFYYCVIVCIADSNEYYYAPALPLQIEIKYNNVGSAISSCQRLSYFKSDTQSAVGT